VCSSDLEVPGNTSHYILAGLSIPISHWKKCEEGIEKLKKKYDLENGEVHTAWLMRKYIEQAKINNFENLSFSQRRSEVEKARKKELLRLQKSDNRAHYKQTKKNYKQTEAYIHLSHSERMDFVKELADMIGKWSFARIFGECIDKIHFDTSIAKSSVDEQALEQLVSRFEQYMKIVSKSTKETEVYGTLIHDNNETVSKKHTKLMKKFHSRGTLWTSIEHIIETPFFVNSELTSLVQIADLCSYALRRYFENIETDLFDRIKSRFDRKNGKIVGLRHFTDSGCACEICG
jgi:chromatin segregation and condensation protein Rec8/ScpA/Scc1 (kleisin family)